jgi:hypothetical protein
LTFSFSLKKTIRISDPLLNRNGFKKTACHSQCCGEA